MLCRQVTYRVVQVTDDQLEASADGSGAVSVVSTAAFAGTPQAVAQVSSPWKTVGWRQMFRDAGGGEEMKLFDNQFLQPATLQKHTVCCHLDPRWS